VHARVSAGISRIEMPELAERLRVVAGAAAFCRRFGAAFARELRRAEAETLSFVVESRADAH